MAKFDYFRAQIEILHLAHEQLNMAVAAEDPADGGGDFARRQALWRHLIEQRLKSMEILAIDESYANRIARERSRGEQASETRADYNHMRTGLAVHHCTLYDSNWCPRSRKVFLKKAYLLLRSLFRSRMSLADQRSASGYRLLSHTVCSKQLCVRPPGGWT